MTQASLQPEVVGRIRDVLAPLFSARGLSAPPDPVTDLRSAGLTSLDMVNLMLAIEGAFDIFIPQEKITSQSFRSIDAIEELVTALI